MKIYNLNIQIIYKKKYTPNIVLVKFNIEFKDGPLLTIKPAFKECKTSLATSASHSSVKVGPNLE